MSRTAISNTRAQQVLLGCIASALLLSACGQKNTEVAAGSAAGPAAPGVTAPSAELMAGLTLATIAASPTIGVCSVENVAVHPGLESQPAKDNKFKAPLGSTVKFIGFATDQNKGEPLTSFTLLLVGEQVWGVSGRSGLERPDVAEYFKKPALAPSGYHLDAGLAKIPAGAYTLWLRNEAGAACPTHQTLVVG